MKKDEEKERIQGWFISSTPWPGCPAVFNLVVITDRNDKAIAKFKSYFHKDDLEITAMFPVEVIDENTEVPTIN
jgi:hypothetical protein